MLNDRKSPLSAEDRARRLLQIAGYVGLAVFLALFVYVAVCDVLRDREYRRAGFKHVKGGVWVP